MKHRTTDMAWRDAQAREIADARTITDLQSYLHEAIKAYDAREMHWEMHWDGIYRSMRETAESQKHRITELESDRDELLRQRASQKHVIIQQNETLDLLYDECDDGIEQLEAENDRLRDDLVLQRKINAQYAIEFAARDGRIAELERSLEIQKNWTETYQHAWLEARLLWNDDNQTPARDTPSP